MAQLIQRYDANERANHWVTAITFILLTLSGLALFHPAFFFLTVVLGGGTWTRVLHPFIGVVLFVSFWLMARRYWDANRITPADRQWMDRIQDVMQNRDEGLPEIGKYNPGQKYLFWTWVVSILLLLVSGVIIWQPWFAPLFPVWLLRIATLVHALAAIVAILGFIAHLYSAIFWVRGSLRAMTRGTVTAAWAKHHHPAWYREVKGR
jgi:formate dehydrogenase subunit gamma